ncbi:MAG: DUF1345 domain-containing protein [Thermoleophilaceae bacterium]
MEVRDLPKGPVAPPKDLARTKVLVSLAAGLAVGIPVAFATSAEFLPLVAWDVACIVFMVWVWGKIWRTDSEETAALAVPEDPTRAFADLLLLIAAVASLVAVGVILVHAAHSHGFARGGRAGLGVISIALSWGIVHTVYMLRYARLYYTGADGGVDFHGDEPPNYKDFAYLAFTIGMTFQVSDTDLETRDFRVAALHHSLLSFVFGTCILASAINLVAQITGQ